MFRSLVERFRDWYVLNHVEQVEIPEFKPDRICRYRIRFSGRVQNVGFRMEAAQIAQKLGLTGFCENLSDGDVLAEFQGPENRIIFLVAFMESLKRIIIEHKVTEEVPVIPQASGFDCR